MPNREEIAAWAKWTDTRETAEYLTLSPTAGSAFTPSTLADVELYVQINTNAGAGTYTLTMGPDTGTEWSIYTSIAVPNNSDRNMSVKVPRGWKVVVSVTGNALIEQAVAVTC